MTNSKYETVLMKDTDFELSEKLAESTEGKHVTVRPNSESIGDVVGVVDSCWYEKDGDAERIMAEITIYDEEIDQMLSHDAVKPCPSMIRDTSGEFPPRTHNVFLSENPSDIVGQCERKS